MKISFALITLVTTTNIMWGAVSKPRASVVGGGRPGSTVDVGRGAGGGASPGTRGGVGQGPGAIVGLSQGAGNGASSSTTVGLGRGAGGGASSGATVGAGQGLGTTVGTSRGAGGGASSGATVGVSQGPSTTVGLDRGAGGGASPSATVGVGQRLGTTVGVDQGAGGGVRPGTTVGVRQVAGGGGTRPGTTIGVGQGAGGAGTSPGTTVGVGQSAGGGGTSPGTTVGVGQGAGGGGTSPGTTVGVGEGAGGGIRPGTTVDVGEGAGAGTSPGTTVGVRQGAGGGASLGTTDGAGQCGGGGATLSKGGSGVVDASLGAGSSTGLATNFSSDADAVLATLTTGMRNINPKKDKKQKYKTQKHKKIKKKKQPKKRKQPKKNKQPLKKKPIRKLCESNGFAPPNNNWCVCNFAGACNKDNKLLTKNDEDLKTLKNYAPQGVEWFKYNRWTLTDNPVPICEGGTVGILYDCDGRIPLYAATVIYGTNAGGKYDRKDSWDFSGDKELQKHVVVNSIDYDGSGCIVHCYEDAEEKGKIKAWDGLSCTTTTKVPSTTSIHRGHMIAATYGFGHGQTNGGDATFTYTNAVPQVGSFNSGRWREAEKLVIDLAKTCHFIAETKNLKNQRKIQARVYVVVGVIPTSFFGKPRFFGSGRTARFSNFQDDAYRLLLPEIMWTAVCCMHSYGIIPIKMAFYGHNSETKRKMEYYDSASDMFIDMKKKWPAIPAITVFPGVPKCN